MASLTLPGRDEYDLALIRRVFDEAETRFSLYRSDSELSRVVAGEIALPQASAELRDAYAAAMDWHLRTAGAFSPNRPDGRIDLNGIVKAMSIAEAGDHLLLAGINDWSINVGGDILCSGRPETGDWITGIVDPVNFQSLLCSYKHRPDRLAIATSGSAERGDHIWLAHRDSAPEFVQVTVAAQTIAIADVLATAIVAGGRDMLDRAADAWSIDAMAVTVDGELLATPGMRSNQLLGDELVNLRQRFSVAFKAD